jgi:beta-lactamase class D
MKQLFPILLFGLIFRTGFSQIETQKNFKPVFDTYGVTGCFVLYDQTADEYVKYNSGLCDTGYIPASTFKIPHSLIALEEKVISDINEVIKWDGHEWPHEIWNRDQTLKTAIKYSCIWVYIGFAEHIGINTYYDYVKAFNYGNNDLTGPPTRFWLAGSLRISANEQVEFLKRFYNYDLPVSKRSTDTVKDLIILKQTDAYILSGKTGAGRLTETENVMWLAGYVEKEGKPFFYAMNFVTDDYNNTKQARLEITKAILKELKVIE